MSVSSSSGHCFFFSALASVFGFMLELSLQDMEYVSVMLPACALNLAMDNENDP